MFKTPGITLLFGIVGTLAIADDPALDESEPWKKGPANITSSPDFDSASTQDQQKTKNTAQDAELNKLRYRLVRLRRTHERLLRDRSASEAQIDQIYEKMVWVESELINQLRRGLDGESKASPSVRRVTSERESATRESSADSSEKQMVFAGFDGAAKQVLTATREDQPDRSDESGEEDIKTIVKKMQLQLDALRNEMATMRRHVDELRRVR